MTETQQVAKIAQEYLTSQEKVRNDLRSIVTLIVVRQQKIELQLSKRGLMKSFLPVQRVEELIALMPITEDTITLKADAQLKRCGGGSIVTDRRRSNTSRPVPLWFEQSRGQMTGWIGLCEVKFPISGP